MADSLRVTLRKSAIGHTAATLGTLRALGLRRVGQTVTVTDSEAVRGMLRAVRFLVAVDGPAGEAPR